jgi:hypothetical protein
MPSMRNLYAKAAIVASSLTSIISAQLRVQLNPSNVRNLPEPDYQLWTVTTEETTSNITIDDAAFTLSSPPDSYLDGDYYKYQYRTFIASLGERVVNQGVTTSSDSAPGPITLTIRGLEEGEHTLLTWHNAWPDVEDIASLSVAVDGEEVASVSL